jgi:hypothetical protein
MIYLAQPYSSPDPAVRQWRFEAGCKAAAALMRAGFNTYSPIAHSHVIAAHGLDRMSHAFWMHVDRPYIEWCSVIAVLMLPGWRRSKGVAAEIDMARKAGKPVIHIRPKTVGVNIWTMPGAKPPCQEATCL